MTGSGLWAGPDRSRSSPDLGGTARHTRITLRSSGYSGGTPGLRTLQIEKSILRASPAPVEIDWDRGRYETGSHCIPISLGTGRLTIHLKESDSEVDGFPHPHSRSEEPGVRPRHLTYSAISSNIETCLDYLEQIILGPGTMYGIAGHGELRYSRSIVTASCSWMCWTVRCAGSVSRSTHMR